MEETKINRLTPFFTAAFLLAALNAVAVGEIWRGALDDVRKEYLLAAQVTGMPYPEIVRKIQIPLAFQQALPMLLGAQVFILQSISPIARKAHKSAKLVIRSNSQSQPYTFYIIQTCNFVKPTKLYRSCAEISCRKEVYSP